VPDPLLAGPADAADEQTAGDLAALWAEVLEVEKEAIHRGTHFFGTGGHSITAIALVTKVNRQYCLGLEVKQLYEEPVFGPFAALVQTERAQTVTVIL
jgi:aryl carrier-like protein